jgi:hypothetical protein
MALSSMPSSAKKKVVVQRGWKNFIPLLDSKTLNERENDYLFNSLNPPLVAMEPTAPSAPVCLLHTGK